MSYFEANTLTDNRTMLYDWDFTESMTDKIASKTAIRYNIDTPTSSGVYIDKYNSQLELGIETIKPDSEKDAVMEIYFGEVDRQTHSTGSYRFLNTSAQSNNYDGLHWSNEDECWFVSSSGRTGSIKVNLEPAVTDPNIFSNSVLKIVIHNNYKIDFYKNDQYLASVYMRNAYLDNNYIFKRFGCYSESKGYGTFFEYYIRGIKIYYTPILVFAKIWDLTKSLTDTLNLDTIDVTNATWVENEGIKLTSASNYFAIPTNLVKNYVLELDIGDSQWVTASRHGRLLMLTTEKGFIYRNTSPRQWQIYSGSWQTNTESVDLTDANMFANSTLKLVSTGDSTQTWSIYKDNTLVWKSTMSTSVSNNVIYIGSSSLSFCPITIKAIRLYLYVEEE